MSASEATTFGSGLVSPQCTEETSSPAIMGTPSATEDMKDTEISLLRTSLAALATQLHDEKQRNAAFQRERQRENEILRAQLEESRHTLMRLRVSSDSNRVSTRRPSNAGEPMLLPARRGSFMDPAPRRRSSLGLGSGVKASAAIPIPGPASCTGLGFGLDSPNQSQFCAFSTSPNPKPLALHRLALRRSSGSPHLGRDSEEDERIHKLRELQQGLQTTKVASRRGSLARPSGLPDFAPSSAEFEWLERDAEARRRLAVGRHSSISGSSIGEDEYLYDYGCYEAPPSAPLRTAGRKNSMAMFENWSRRSSSSSATSNSFFTTGQYTTYETKQENVHASLDDPRELRLQLEGLRIQLADAEEGRRASELCLKALRNFVSARTDVVMPALPDGTRAVEYVEALQLKDNEWPASGAVSASLTSAAGSPDLSTLEPRRDSSSATLHATPMQTSEAGKASRSSIVPPRGPIRTASAPIFGGFSFTALTPRRSSATALESCDVSPSMCQSEVFTNANPDSTPSRSRTGSTAQMTPTRGSQSPAPRGSLHDNEDDNSTNDEAAARAAAANVVSRQNALASGSPTQSPRTTYAPTAQPTPHHQINVHQLPVVPLSTPGSETAPSLSSGASSPMDEDECPFEDDEDDEAYLDRYQYEDDSDDDALEAELDAASLNAARKVDSGKAKRAQAHLQSLQSYFQPRSQHAPITFMQ